MFIFTFFLFISFSSIFSQNATNGTINQTKIDLNEEITFDFDPYENIDFGNLIYLDDTNSTQEINKYETVYVFFHAAFCEPCYNMIPIYVQAQKMAAEKKLNVTFFRIDGRLSANTTENFELRQFPSLFLIHKGRRFFFEGKRTPEGILKFIDRKLNKDIIKLDTLAQINEYLNSSYLTLLSTIKDKQNQLYKSFETISQIKNNIDFIVCTSDECIKEYNENIILFKEYDEKINLFTKEIGPIEKADSDSLPEFIAVYSLESGGPLTANEVNMMFEYKRNMIMYFRDSNNENHTKHDKIIKELGLELRTKKIYACTSDIENDPIQSEIANAFKVLPIDLPVFLLYDQNINSKEGDLAQLFILRNVKEEQFSKEYFLKYIDDIIAGKVRNTLYSEPPLDNYYDKGLKIIIGRTFDSDVLDNKNNVLLALTNGAIVSPATDRVLEVMQNLSKKYNEQEDKILFAYSNAQNNQPRDVVIAGQTPPIVLLYTNAMSEKKKIELQSNFTTITEEEVENFLMENLGWKQKKEYKEPKEKKDVKIEEKKEKKKEEKKDDKKEEDKKMTDL